MVKPARLGMESAQRERGPTRRLKASSGAARTSGRGRETALITRSRGLTSPEPPSSMRSQTMTEEVAQKALGRLRSGPSPILVMVGLPVSDAWWVRMAEDNGCPAIFHTSYANRANLSEAWFKATEALPPAEREAMVMNKTDASDRVGLFGVGRGEHRRRLEVQRRDGSRGSP